jgi:flavodoxin
MKRSSESGRGESGVIMKTLVIYDSVFGNTEKVARAIAESLGLRAPVEVLRPDLVVPEHLAGVDLLVVGSPTRGFRPTEAMAGLLNRLRSKALQGVKVAAFDTRLKADELKSTGLRFLVKTGGYAARRIANKLTKAGGSLIAPPEGFYVEDTEGPLKAGELERASAWGASLLDTP